MKRLAALLAFLVATSAFAADRAAEVRQAEIDFAKAFTDHDEAKFRSFLADDANFLQRKRTLAGKDIVMSVWSELLKQPAAPFSWSPERVVVNKKGDIGLSTGPVLDASGKHIADYSSIWQRQRDGKWKVIFDGPGAAVCDEK